MAKITPRKERESVSVKTGTGSKSSMKKSWAWWEAKSQREMAMQLIETANYLRTNQQYRFRQAGIFARMYGNLPLFNFIGSNLNKMGGSSQLPIDRPTMNVVQSCIDTKVSRITQSRPRPVFLTDNSDYKQRTLAKQLNGFLCGELYQTKAYEVSEFVLRDAEVLGTGCLKVVETTDKKVGIERRLVTELLVDGNDAMYGNPRCLYEFKLVDRAVAMAMFPNKTGFLDMAEQAYPDNSKDSSETVSDQIMLVEAWRLPSSKEAKDGLHAIACSAGLVDSEEYDRQTFPFVFLHSSPRLLGMWAQGCPERLMGTQVEINKLLMTISRSINLVGVPRVFLEDGSKVVKAHLNNEVGAIVTYRGTKPIYEVAPCVPAEIYAQLQRLIEYGYQQEGISQMAAASVKPAGLDSGEAQREFNNTQTDRLAALSKRYDNMFIDLSYQIMDKAIEIAERDGKYQTIYPNKDGTREVNLPDIAKLKEDPFVIQCFESSSLPRDPAGRKQEVVEMMQSGLVTPQEGRRLLDFPDLEQQNKLANAGEERILKVLDEIVESGGYEPPDPFMDLGLAEQLCVQYINLYMAAGLEESKAQKLRDFFTQIQTMKMAAMPPPMPMQQGAPMANPEALPVSPMIPNVPQQ
jgi:hypothetical protein